MRAIVDAPGLFQHAHSLENVANVVTGERADLGVSFNPKGCEVVFSHDAGCWVGDSKALQQCHLSEFNAFLLELTLVWALGDLPADPKARAIEAMAVGSSAILERCASIAPSYTGSGTNMTVPALAGPVSTTGIKGKASIVPARVTQPYLTNAAPVAAATPVTGPVALGLLEAKLIDGYDHIGSGGTIWMSPAHIAATQDQLVTVNGQLRTLATGSRVIVGNVLPNEMYATVGEVDLYLGPIEIVEASDRPQNEYVVQVERTGVAVWNTCAAFKAVIKDPKVDGGGAPFTWFLDPTQVIDASGDATWNTENWWFILNQVDMSDVDRGGYLTGLDAPIVATGPSWTVTFSVPVVTDLDGFYRLSQSGGDPVVVGSPQLGDMFTVTGA